MTVQSDGLLAAVHDQLRKPDWRASADGTKRVLSEAIRKLDHTANVEDTGYFNHSFIPDFVLSWGGVEARRDVHVRLDSAPASFELDLDALAENGSVFVGLDASEDSPRWQDVDARAAETNTMRVDLGGLEELPAREQHFSSVVPGAVLRGGRGVIGRSEAHEIQESGLRFFNGAMSHTQDDVVQSSRIIEDRLSEVESQRLFNYGRVIWQAGGGAPADYPLHTKLTRLDRAAIEFLLQTESRADLAFWRSVGTSVDLGVLFELDDMDSRNLDSLVGANLDRLECRALAVNSNPSVVSDRHMGWSIARKTLALNGSDFTAYIGITIGSVRHLASEQRILHPRELPQRVDARNIDSVVIEASDSTVVTIENEEGFRPWEQDVYLALQADALSKVKSVRLQVSDGHIECEFSPSVAHGQTSATFALRSMLLDALPVLWPLRTEDKRALAEVMNNARDAASSEEGKMTRMFD